MQMEYVTIEREYGSGGRRFWFHRNYKKIYKVIKEEFGK